MPDNPCSDEDFIQFFSQDGARTLADKLDVLKIDMT